TFGWGTIRQFNNNVSDMKNFAAQDYEDLLQCAMPCFEGLFPSKLNKLVLDLLFVFACWHANAKLQMHTEMLLLVFERFTSILGTLMQKFKHEIDVLDTCKIPKEREARAHQQINSSKKKGSAPKKKKMFSLSTYKYHAMGDYPAMIHAFGTTDLYSTQSVSDSMVHFCWKNILVSQVMIMSYILDLLLHFILSWA
ncbi:hypothetical protein EDD85DRAFT_778146, partial [Armillaria nabsnona]